MMLPRSRARLLFSAALLFALTGCGQDSPPPAPTEFKAFSGDNTVTLTWKQEQGLTYYLYLGQGMDATQDSILGLPDSRLVSKVTAPFSFTVNANEAPYVSLITATKGSSKGGGTTKSFTTTRPAGQAYASATVPGSEDLLDVAFGLNRYVAVTVNGLQSATGPQDASGVFQPVTLPPVTGALRRVVFMTTPTVRFLAIGDQQMLSSPDGITWSAFTPTFVTAAGAPVATRPVFRAVTQSGATTLAVGDHGAIFSSGDAGQTWVERRPANTSQKALLAVASALGRFIAAGEGGELLQSVDLQTWTPFTPSGFTKTLRALAGSGADAVAAGDDGSILYMDLDGSAVLRVTVQTSVPAGTPTLRAAALGNRYLLTGDGGQFLFSGPLSGQQIAWTAASVTSSASPRPAQHALAVAYGRVLSVGAAGSRFVSPTAQ